ncbi:hypothetical protein JCM12107_08590 [Corynebacterium simulans]
MEEKRLSSLFFGNVVLESQVLGTFPKIYADDMHSYWMRPSRDGMLSVPLDESVSSCLCVGLDFLEVLVKAVRVGHGHLVDGLFPPGNLSAFNEPAS